MSVVRVMGLGVGLLWVWAGCVFGQGESSNLADDLVPLAKAVHDEAGTRSHEPQHGWITTQSITGDGVAVFHLPPREMRGVGGVGGVGANGADSGTARSVRVIESMPYQIGSWGSRVYLFYRTTAATTAVYSLGAVSGGIENYWLIEPGFGAAAELSLSTEGERVVDAVGVGQLGGKFGRSEGSAAVLLRGQAGWSIKVLGADGWQPMKLPDEMAHAGADLRLVDGHRTLGVVELARTPRVWSYDTTDGHWMVSELDTAAFKASGAGEASAVGDAAVKAGAGSEAGGKSDSKAAESLVEPELLRVFDRAGMVCLAVWHRSSEGGVGVVGGGEVSGLEVWSLGPDIGGRLVQLALPSRPLAVVPMAAGSRLVIFEAVKSAKATQKMGATTGPIHAWELVEVSLDTGRVLYRGPPMSGSLISVGDTRLLSMVMLGLSLGMLFYLLRPVGREESLVMPEGFALADPGTRGIATLLDVVIVAGVASKVLGVSMVDLVFVLPLMSNAGGVGMLVAYGAIGVGYGTVSEWLFGRTIGKAMVGSRVVSVVSGRSRVGLLRSGARNAFKWAFPPWALLGMFTYSGRHRGDEVAGAAVVVPTDPQPREEEIADPDSGDA